MIPSHSDPTPRNVIPHDILKSKLPYSAEGLLPHGAPFTFIDRIIDEWEGGGKTASVIRPDNPLAAANGETGAEVLIEYAAQTCAALDSFQHEDKTSSGLLVEVVESSYTAVPRVGDLIEVEINVQYDLGKWRGISYRVNVNGTSAAEGVLKLCILSDQ